MARARDPFQDLEVAWLASKPGRKWARRGGDDVLASWVADMDFPVASVILDAIRSLLDLGDLGYPDWAGGSPLRELFSERMSGRYSWQPSPSEVLEFTDVIQGLEIVLFLTTKPGDAVAVHTPTYPPFLASLRKMGRRLLPIQLQEVDGSWTWDLDRLEHEVRSQKCRVLLLVNPQNPTGHVFSRLELEQLGELALRQGLLIIADEVHCDLVYEPRQHVPVAALSSTVEVQTITFNSATKSHNLGGIRCSVGHLGPVHFRRAIEEYPERLFGTVGVLSVAATVAAWTQGDIWLSEVRRHLHRNRQLLGELVQAALPGVTYSPPSASYLAWLGCSALRLPQEPAAFFLDRGRVALTAGQDFGPGGAGQVRLNFATSQEMLRTIVERMGSALELLRRECRSCSEGRL
jgi:cysteine-S-conjugate beta-lyase